MPGIGFGPIGDMRNSNNTNNSTTIVANIYMVIAIFQAVFRTLYKY